MFHRFLTSAVAAALIVLGSGCSIFDNSDQQEDNSPIVTRAYDDPSGINNTGLDGIPGGGFDGPGIGEFGPGANDSSFGTADPDGWVAVDPANRLNWPVIYFAYDSDLLVPSETANLDRILNYLADKPDLAILIEGHCDQRGTEEYNRALGERRANAIRAYLTGKGLEDSRIKTVSYGKDRPAGEGDGENIWAQNRRGVPVPMRMPRR